MDERVVELPSTWRALFGAYVGPYVTDLLVGFGYLGLATGVLLTRPDSTLLRAVVGLPLVVFAPGYGLVAALFPSDDRGVGAASGRNRDRTSGRFDLVERAALAAGTSVALLPMFGLTLTQLGYGFALRPVVALLASASAVGLFVAAIRRARLPRERRFRLPLNRWVRNAKAATVGRRSRVDGALNVALALAVATALVLFGYGLLGTSTAETDTTVMILTENGEGALAANGYPENLTRNESAPLSVTVHNGEGERVDYTLLGRLERVDASGSSVAVEESQTVVRSRQVVGTNRTWRANHTVTPELSGSTLRLTYYVYEGDPPAEPSLESAYRHAYVWVNVTSPPRQTALETASGANTTDPETTATDPETTATDPETTAG